MSDLLLQTKLFAPTLRPSLIPRPQLIAQLNANLGRGAQGFSARLTLVSAPAGFGKTTLLADWGSQLADSAATPQKIKLAWLSLDDGDNDPVRFLTNRSSGKQGFALAQAAVDLGAEVTLVSGPVTLSTPHGVRRMQDVHEMALGSLPATCFPTASCLASTWDVDLIRRMGEALADECIALNVDVLLGPGANMKRSPLCGRNFEYFSEDPYLAGEMAASLINGVQSRGVGTSLKHYAVNNQEFQRFTISAEVDERTLREIYLPAFEKAVKEAQPWTVMCSYNKVNGVLASEHHTLLTKILKEEWGFEGLVVSDWGAVRDRVASLRGGLDWEMPGPRDRRVEAVVEAVRSGALAEATLDESVRRILRIVFKAQKTPKGGTFDLDAHHRLAHKIAAEGMVLLKNDPLPEQIFGQEEWAFLIYPPDQCDFTEDVREVREGFECGIGISNFDDFEEGDLLEFFVRERVR